MRKLFRLIVITDALIALLHRGTRRDLTSCTDGVHLLALLAPLNHFQFNYHKFKKNIGLDKEINKHYGEIYAGKIPIYSQ